MAVERPPGRPGSEVAAPTDPPRRPAILKGWWSAQDEEFLSNPGRAVGVASVMLGLFVVVAVVVPAGPLGLDSRWSELMEDIETAFLTHVALVFDALGHGIWRALTLAGIALVLVVARRWVALAAFALAEALTPLLVNLAKVLVGRERPPGHMIEAHGSSFPSGHAAYAGATTIALVLLSRKPGRQRHVWFALAAVAVAGMVWSRTYLQVHWLSDALAGAALGVAVALLCFGGLQLALNGSGRRG